jgi:hypothetical protein
MFSAALRVIGGNITQAKKVGKYSFCRFLAGRRTAGRRAREGAFQCDTENGWQMPTVFAIAMVTQ